MSLVFHGGMSHHVRTLFETEGFAPLTVAYTPDEYWMMLNVLADLKRGGISFLLVNEHRYWPQNISIYRKPATIPTGRPQ